MKKQLKQFGLALAFVAVTIGAQQAYAFITSEKVYLKNSISEARDQQVRLANDNKELREILPEAQRNYEKYKQQLENVKHSINANSTQWEFLEMEIQNKEFRLSIIEEWDKNLGK